MWAGLAKRRLIAQIFGMARFFLLGYHVTTLELDSVTFDDLHPRTGVASLEKNFPRVVKSRMRLFVTGGAGYIGSHAVRRFREAGHEPWVYDNLSTGHSSAVGDCPLWIGELDDEKTLTAALSAVRFDAVVHLAGAALVGESVREPLRYYSQNTSHGIALLKAMHRQGINRLVMSSTCAVYGQPAGNVVNEDSPLCPINPYARSKLALEWSVADCATAFGLGAIVLRYFNAAGAHHQGDLGEDHTPETHLIPNALRVALGQDQCIQICGSDYATPDGTCQRDYVHVEDLAEAHLLALERIIPGQSITCNLGSSTPYSVHEVIEQCRLITGQPIPALLAPRRPGDAASLSANTQRARNFLGWEPRHSALDNIVSTAWEWHSRHPLGYGDLGVSRLPLPLTTGLRRAI